MTKLPDLMFWHLGIWISFDIWILKFGFFRQNHYFPFCNWVRGNPSPILLLNLIILLGMTVKAASSKNQGA